MSTETFDSLFKAMVRDNGAENSEDDYKRFHNQIKKSFSKGVLDMSGQRIGINVLTKLTKVLRTAPHIRVFNFYGNMIRDHGIHTLVQLLKANLQVEVLDLGCNDLTNQAVSSVIDIIRSTRIYSLQLGTRGVAWHNNKFSLISIGEMIQAVKEANRIKCLGLSGLKMSVRQGSRRVNVADEVSEFVGQDAMLRTLTLSGCDFAPKEIRTVCDGLLKNSRIRYLDFHENPLADPVGPVFLGSIWKMAALSYLDLRECQLSGKAGVAFAQALSKPNMITVLNLSKNKLGDEGVGALLSVIADLQTLTELDLSDNGFSDACAESLEDMLKRNHVLCLLNLSQNSLSDAGACAVANAMLSNDSIDRLQMSSCKITDYGAKELAEAFVANTNCKSLCLSDNFITRECGYAILQSLRHNETLFSFDISATQVDHFVIKAIADLCKRNRQIQKGIALQPMKKQIIQLSIQRMKIPEAQARLTNAENTRDNLEREVIEVEGELETTEATSNTNIRELLKAIEDTKHSIVEEKEARVKLEAEKEKTLKEYEDRYQDIQGDMVKEKALLENLEKKTVEIEEDMVKNNEETEKQKAEILETIEKVKALLEQALEVSKDPEKIREYEQPEMPKLQSEIDYEKIFLVDQIAELQFQDSKKSSRKSGRKSSRSNKSARRTSRSARRTKRPESPEIGKRKGQKNEENEEPKEEQPLEEPVVQPIAVEPIVEPPALDPPVLEEASTEEAA